MQKILGVYKVPNRWLTVNVSIHSPRDGLFTVNKQEILVYSQHSVYLFFFKLRLSEYILRLKCCLSDWSVIETVGKTTKTLISWVFEVLKIIILLLTTKVTWIIETWWTFLYPRASVISHHYLNLIWKCIFDLYSILVLLSINYHIF